MKASCVKLEKRVYGRDEGAASRMDHKNVTIDPNGFVLSSRTHAVRFITKIKRATTVNSFPVLENVRTDSEKFFSQK